MRKVYVLSGISGSGKSTLAKALHKTFFEDCLIVSADDFFMKEGQYDFCPSKLSEAHADCFRRFMDQVMAHQTVGKSIVIVDNTNLSNEEIAPYMLGARAFGWDAEVVTIQCMAVTARSRNVHGLTERAILGQSDRLRNRQLPSYWQARTLTDMDVSVMVTAAWQEYIKS